ncbi:carbon-nitrogen hydrolase family protein [Tissierella creatinini]|nr:carbon-nitrogen hydrolase family protein [Tissierella creatinini]TJX66739.1 carbon-nitrogen hydrolase family protein [Soehngenia saccharolytica]
MGKVNIASIQMKVSMDKKKNIETAGRYVKEVVANGANLAVLPEMFSCPYKTTYFPEYAEEEGGYTYRRLSEFAKVNSVYLVGGSMPEKSGDNIYNTSYIFDRDGSLIGKHRKMHLFDVDIKGGQYFKESDILTPGDELNVFETEFGKIGVAICYDFRFPEVGRILVQKGAKIIIVPAAFNMTTGPVHWELMFRSRAVDNQIYTIGVAPSRDESSFYISYGNSIVVSPWGEVVSRMDEKEGYVINSLDLDYIEEIREQLPLLKHIRRDIYILKEIDK